MGMDFNHELARAVARGRDRDTARFFAGRNAEDPVDGRMGEVVGNGRPAMGTAGAPPVKRKAAAVHGYASRSETSPLRSTGIALR